MGLKDIDKILKASYDSDEDDILNEFYIPALSESVSYKRLAGFFTSNSFAIAAKGLSKFILNGGKIQLIANVILSKEDYEKIKEVTEAPFLKKAEEEFIESLETIEDELIKDHVKMLGWMLKNNKLEMQISLVQEGQGIQHQKTGILEDSEGNIISFTGSDNETKKGWIDNIENFHIFKSWKEGDKDHIKADVDRFEKFWKNEGVRSKVFSISEAVKNSLIRIAPKTDYEFEKLSEEVTKQLLKEYVEKRKKRKETVNLSEPTLILRKYQERAVENWFNNNKQGFFKMATGTGKTETAIGVIQQMLNKKEPLFIVIVAQGNSLVSQWIEKLRKYGYESIGASSNFSRWRAELKKEEMKISLGYKDYTLCVTTYETFSSKDFMDIMNKIEGKSLLICDEVHHAAAEQTKRGLLENYKYRLGLSATPERWFDEEGTNILKEYFGKTVYTFSMKRAIDEEFLCQYDYHPIIVNLTGEENERFIELTQKISRRIYTIGKFNRKDTILSSLLIKRADIKKNAELKIEKLDELFGEIGDSLKDCIIYCSGKQMGPVKELLQKYNRIFAEFTQHQNSEERKRLLEGFSSGRSQGGWDVLLAIDCLNEGIDIPSAKVGIFLESSLNPIEFIQRRGRLLRKSKGKEKAIVYDFIVDTFLGAGGEKYQETERKEMQKEFDRFIEFARLASNTQDALKVMKKLISEYALVINIKEEEEVL